MTIENGDRLSDREMPEVDYANPADLEAWFGNFGGVRLSSLQREAGAE